MAISSILAATDETEGGRHAVRVAAALAGSTGAHLTIVKVLSFPSHGDVSAGHLPSSLSPDGSRSGDLQHFVSWLGEAGLGDDLDVF